ncbi:hypothetical protein [Mycobacterium sp.]|uniref:hypothetical protein n=1 Tax=Mycobacterium sp. TaxID=1785 RepID=UPI00283E3908|nr:hypothetical protein [Mycobacterium sp.]HKI39435.1 hypothetical protein [Mycobacterium sp.]
MMLRRVGLGVSPPEHCYVDADELFTGNALRAQRRDEATTAATKANGEHRQTLLCEAVANLAQAVVCICQAELADT